MDSDKVCLQLIAFLHRTHRGVGIRNFIVGVTVKVASDEATLRKEKTYINKLNLALVQASQHITFVRNTIDDAQYRFSSKNGLTIGRRLSTRSFLPVTRACQSAKIIWQSYVYCRKKSLTIHRIR